MKNNKWTKYTIDQLVMICNEKIDSKILNKFNYVSATNLLPNIGGLIPADSIPSSKVTKFKKGDILFSNIRPYFKKLLYATFDGGCSNDVIVFRSKEEIIPKFFYYLISQQYFIDFVTASSKGTKMPRGDKDAIKKFEFYVPSRIIQEKITNILSSLDSKIELNNQINEKLEETAKALYKEWFVNFNFPDENGLPYKDNGGEFVDSELGKIPVGWNVGKLDDIIIDITSGVSTKVKSELSDDIYKYPVIGASRTMAYSNDYNIDSKVLIIGRVGTLGVVQRINEKVWATDNTLIVNTSYYEYVYNILKTLDYKSLNRGSTQPLITRTDIRNTKIIIPNEQILTIFENLLLPFSNQLENCIKETKVLDKIKNILLSKLMSGQIDVDKLNIDWDKLDKTLKEVENLV